MFQIQINVIKVSTVQNAGSVNIGNTLNLVCKDSKTTPSPVPSPIPMPSLPTVSKS